MINRGDLTVAFFTPYVGRKIILTGKLSTTVYQYKNSVKNFYLLVG